MKHTALPARVSPERWLYKLCAWALGYFWAPCPLCGNKFGGNEWRDAGGTLAQIPGRGQGGRAICPECTRSGRGNDYPSRWWDLWLASRLRLGSGPGELPPGRPGRLPADLQTVIDRGLAGQLRAASNGSRGLPGLGDGPGGGELS